MGAVWWASILASVRWWVLSDQSYPYLLALLGTPSDIWSVEMLFPVLWLAWQMMVCCQLEAGYVVGLRSYLLPRYWCSGCHDVMWIGRRLDVFWQWWYQLSGEQYVHWYSTAWLSPNRLWDWRVIAFERSGALPWCWQERRMALRCQAEVGLVTGSCPLVLLGWAVN